MLGFEYALDAKLDLVDIAEYTRLNFGEDQTVHYKAILRDTIDTICQFPNIGSDYSHIRANYRRFPVQKHVIYYRELKGKIRIERILNMNQDPLHQFSDD